MADGKNEPAKKFRDILNSAQTDLPQPPTTEADQWERLADDLADIRDLLYGTPANKTRAVGRLIKATKKNKKED